MTQPTPGRSGHVIVCGLHGVGMRIVEQLHAAGVPVVVVDDAPEQRLVQVVHGLGVPLVPLSPLLPETLWEAGLRDAIAVIAVESDDLASLEVALHTKDLRPDVRVVARVTNPTVGNAVEAVTGTRTVLSVPTLTATTFIEACLGTAERPLDVPGEDLIAVTTVADVHDSLRARYGDLAPVAVVSHADGETVVCPGRDHTVSPGDAVTLVGPRAEARARAIAPPPEEPNQAVIAQRNARRWVRRANAALASEAGGALRAAVAAAGVLVAISTVVLSLAYRVPQAGGGTKHLPPLDALYFTLQTVATVGFGDFSFTGQPRWLEGFGILLIVTGAVVVATSVALLTNFIVSRSIERSLGRTRTTTARGHVVVIGLGGVGVRVAQGLRAAGREVVLVDRDDNNRFAAEARDQHIPLIVGDATNPRTLRAAGVDRARAVAVLTSDDLTNIETGLVVRDVLGDRWSRARVVLRVFDRPLARTVSASFGFRHVYSTADLAAPWFVGSALGLDVRGSFYVADRPFLLGRLTVNAGGGLAGIAMADLDARTRVVALARAANGLALEHPPRRDTRFDPGDEAYLVGPSEEITRVLRRDRAGADPDQPPCPA
ncbi:MAG TPA: NAD-binding protein [Mycobacteriales bacterium]|nr:NAD-binding protein [Mycobacteriales bacterium]